MDEQPTKKREWNKIPFEKGTPEYLEEARRRHNEKSKAYHARKRAEDPPPEAKQQRPGEAPPLPGKTRPVEWTVPDDDVLREVVGGKITLPEDWSRWPIFHVRRQDDLSKTTMNQYRVYYHKLPRTDIFSVVKFIMEQSPATQNMYAKAGLSYVCQSLYDSIYSRATKYLAKDKDYKDRLLRMMVFSILNKRTKAESYERHISQEASDERVEATVPWSEWAQLGKNYIRAKMAKGKDLTDKDRKDMLLVYVYSQLPPVRLDWNDVKVVRCKGRPKFSDEKALRAAVEAHSGGNVLYLSSKHAVICWSEFKNAASFAGKPVCTDLSKAPSFVKMMNRIMPAGDSEPLKIANFSSYLTKLAEDLTGKRFSNRLMRSSYIRWWHEHNDSTNVKAVQAMMREIHQTNVAVHLGYIKHKTTDGDLTD
jgi:hypothetical protein